MIVIMHQHSIFYDSLPTVLVFNDVVNFNL